jgi:hypothetical protein
MLEQDIEQNSAKLGKKFLCDLCDYKCYYKSDLLKHKSTAKHKHRTHLNTLEPNIEQNSAKLGKAYMCLCGRSFGARNSLWYHKKKCITTSTPSFSPSKNSAIEFSKEGFDALKQKYFTCKCGKLFETIQTYNDHIDVCKVCMMPLMVEGLKEVAGSTTNTNSYNNFNHSYNKTFNISMFLNENCKDAMNLTDFIESLPVTPQILNDTRENGLTQSLTNMMVDGLNSLDLYKRPIHCTDPKRKIMYIKDNDVWEKDDEQSKIKQGVTKLAVKQRANIHNWQDGNDDWEKDENMQIKFTNLVGKALQLSDQEPKEQNKIIKGICSATYLDNKIKGEFNK